MSGYTIKEHQGLKYISFGALEETGLVNHAFTSRIGGVSTDPYKSLNMAFRVGDCPKSVLENRKRSCEVLGAGLEDMVCGQQVHGISVHVVTPADRGRGAQDYAGGIPETDALITDQPGLLLASFYADCVPILIVDPIKKSAGLVHAGWKGTVAGIAGAAVEAMNRAFGTNPKDCVVAIAPSIGPCCYEVDQTVIQSMKAYGVEPSGNLRPSGSHRWKLDLPGLNRDLLIKAGVKKQSITLSGLCTACHSDLFFSYRGQSGTCGRMASLIMLK